MNISVFSDEELMAYADGQLDEKRALELDRALGTDAALAERLALFVDTRAEVAKAYAPMLEEPVPDALMQRIRHMAEESDAASQTGTVVAFRPRLPIWQTAIAASIALAIGFGTGLFLGNSRPDDGLHVGTVKNPDILAALSNLPAGEQRVMHNGDKITVIETFRDGANAICREFSYQPANRPNMVAVGCYDNGWAVKLALETPPNDAGYTPASALPALDAYLNSIGAKAPLSQKDEQQVLEGFGQTINP